VRTEHLNDADLQSAADRDGGVTALQARHLDECPACREAVAGYRRLFEGLSAAEPRFGLPPSFARSVLARTESLRPPRPLPEPLPWAAGLSLSAAAAAAAAVIAFWMPVRVKHAAHAGLGLAAAVLHSVSAWIPEAARSFRPPEDGVARWLAAALTTLAFTALCDALVRRTRQVPVDKRG
jgi:predicted anti-sigma-YlaC factor YlaD